MTSERTQLCADGRKVWILPGGLELPGHKQMSTQEPVRAARIPRQLVIPMQQHIGETCEPLVRPGDRVLTGQKIADTLQRLSAPIHASSSGVVTEVGSFPVPHASGMSAPCVVIETDGRDEWVDRPGCACDFRDMNRAEVLRRIREAGLVGMGGAGFSSSVKLTPESGQGIHTLIINGAECEPYISCDDMLMREQAPRIMDGIGLLMELLEAERCLVGIEDNKPEAIEAMCRAARNAGLEHVEVVGIPTIYPSGGEKQLIYILTGLEVPSGDRPSQLGMICHNVGTVHAIARAVMECTPLIERYITVTGEGVAHPCNLKVRVGTLISELIQEAGGYSGRQSRLIVGGPMMGYALPNDEFPVIKSTNCVLVPGQGEAGAVHRVAPCIRCGRCAEVCPMLLLPQQMYWHVRARNFEKARDYNLFDCIECGCCSHVCPSHIPLVQYYRHGKSELRNADADQARAQLARRRTEQRDARLARLEAEKQAKLAAKKREMQKKLAEKQQQDAVEADPRKAAIEAALKRAQAKRAQLAAEGKAPKNTEGLAEFQQRQIDASDQRRAEAERLAAEQTKD